MLQPKRVQKVIYSHIFHTGTPILYTDIVKPGQKLNALVCPIFFFFLGGGGGGGG